MSGKYFVKRNGVNVDLTELFEPNGTPGANTYYPDLDISNDIKDINNNGYLIPDEFGYKIKDANDNITDLSKYCYIRPNVYISENPDLSIRSVNISVNISDYKEVYGYIVGGSGGGGGGSGGAWDTNSDEGYNGGKGGFGEGGRITWFDKINIENYNEIILQLGSAGKKGDIPGANLFTGVSYGKGGMRYRGSNGWSRSGLDGQAGGSSKITIRGGSSDLVINAAGGGGGNKGNRVSTSGSGGDDGNTPGGEQQRYNNYTYGNPSNANTSYNIPALFTNTSVIKSSNNNPEGVSHTLSAPRNYYGTTGGNRGSEGNVNNTNENANWGGDGGDGEPGYAVLYLKR